MWTKDYPTESGWYYTRQDRHGFSIRWIDVSTKTVWFGKSYWTFEEYSIFDEEFGDKIPEPDM